MAAPVATASITYQDRLNALRETKLLQTREKRGVLGPMDYDDWGIVLPPPEMRRISKAVSGSGVEITDVLIDGIQIESNHPSGGWFGPEICGKNFRKLLDAHPSYVDPMSSLAGAYMANFGSYRQVHWPEELDFPRAAGHDLYGQTTGIGDMHHMCQDLAIGLRLGWGGLLKQIRFYRDFHAPAKTGFYNGLEHVVLGIQDWIRRTAEKAAAMAEGEPNPELRTNLEQIADINERLITGSPETFREACQWIAWYQMTARMYNGNGSTGRLDMLLRPYYERDLAGGHITREEAVFYVACLYLKETGYIQLGGPDIAGNDATNPVSYICLEAAHSLRVPTNIGVAVGENADEGLLKRGVEILFEDRAGTPKFLGVENMVKGFIRNGVPLEAARSRAFAGCHDFGIPGREYCLATGSTVNLAGVFEASFHELLSDATAEPAVTSLWDHFTDHLERSVGLVADCFDFHMQHMHEVFPELMVDLCCHGPIEKGLDCSQPGGLEYVNRAVDAMGLATVADSFAAVEQRIERERRLSWAELKRFVESDWAGTDGERARLMMQNIDRYGYGGSRADEWAQKIARTFASTVKAKPTPEGHNMIPGLYSWLANVAGGSGVGATPDGRRRGEPISHGASPNPGFRRDGAATAMSRAITSVELGWGNTSTMQMELNLAGINKQAAIDRVVDLIQTHMKTGGTLINLNIVDKEKIRAAYENPESFPDLIVRVTGFSAYWSSLSPDLRRQVMERVVSD